LDERLMLFPAIVHGTLALAVFATSAHATGFIAPDAFDWRAVVPPPPATGSILDESERDIVLLLEANRTPEQAALAHRYETYNVFSLLRPVLGDWATAENLPKLAALFQQATVEARPFNTAAKDAYARPRPHLALPQLKTAYATKPDGFAYPSGHATGSALHAALLAELLPGYSADWQQQAELVRLSRLYGGAHYPSDLVAGQRLGEAIARKMLESQKFRAALDAVRAELAPFLRRKAA
jgi:acid phosphatase (class A)